MTKKQALLLAVKYSTDFRNPSGVVRKKKGEYAYVTTRVCVDYQLKKKNLLYKIEWIGGLQVLVTKINKP
jgi:hypothetical protein